MNTKIVLLLLFFFVIIIIGSIIIYFKFVKKNNTCPDYINTYEYCEDPNTKKISQLKNIKCMNGNSLDDIIINNSATNCKIEKNIGDIFLDKNIIRNIKEKNKFNIDDNCEGKQIKGFIKDNDKVKFLC